MNETVAPLLGYIEPTIPLRGVLHSFYQGFGLQALLAFVAIPTVWWAFTLGEKLPIINPQKWTELTVRERLLDFGQRSKELFLEGRRRFQKDPYRINCEWGDVVVLHPDFIDEVRNVPAMNFAIPTSDDLHSYIPGFDPFVASDGFARVVRMHLTKALARVTGPLNREATRILRENISDETEWHDFVPKAVLPLIVAGMSSRVFMGEELCRDKDWIKASSDWIVQGFILRDIMGQYPRFMRPYIHWFMPSCWKLRKMLKRTQDVLNPHIARRVQAKEEATKRGETLVYHDCIEWFAKEYRPGYDPAIEQMTLTLVANHTTADLTQQVMLDIATHPELVQPLREEIIRVLSTHGLAKTSLYELKLMDSVMKETQRLKPVMMSTMRRLATEDITLSNGYVIKKGTRTLFENTHMWSEKYYENPLKYDPYRWMRMREDPSKQFLAHLVSTSTQHLGFGHGMHSCPGRFFAANEVKILLCHLLLKYDWKLPEGVDSFTPWIFGMGIMCDQKAKLMIKRRTPELDMDSLSGVEFEDVVAN